MTIDEAIKQLQEAADLPASARLRRWQEILSDVSDAAFMRGQQSVTDLF